MSTHDNFTRRAFVTTAITSGFALAVQPVHAETLIHTDEKGLVTETVHLKTTNGPLPAFVASPEGKGPFPVVLVVQEIFGVHEHIKDVCRRFAKLGAMAIAPELYARHADVSKISDLQEILKNVVSKVVDAQVLADLDSAVAWAAESGRAAKDKLGITGFCWGGRITWLYCERNPKVKAGVAWYGRLAGDPSANQPKHPIDLAGELKVPVLGLYGGKDTGIPLDSVEKMKAALPKAPKSEIVVYPEAGHAFFADYRPSYTKTAAEDGWKRAVAWFKTHGVLGKAAPDPRANPRSLQDSL